VLRASGHRLALALWLAGVTTPGITVRAQDAPVPPLPAQAERPDWNWADDTRFPSTDFAESKATCRRLRTLEPPAADRPDAATAATLADCDAEALLYGIDMPADATRARQCAFVQADSAEGRAGKGGPFEGTALLMTLYANGAGVPRNLDLATSLACRLQGAAMENSDRVRHLQALKTQPDHRRFDYCDDITSGYAGGQCAQHDAALADARRARKFAAVTQGWDSTRRAAFEPLSAAAEAYAQSSSDNEVDLSGTARAAFMVEQKQALDAAFMALLKSMEAGTLAPASASDFADADAQLNTLYRQLMQTRAAPDQRGAYGTADSLPYSTVTHQGIRDTQRAWLHYRDAWLTFAATAYPATHPDTLRTHLTRDRNEQLRNLLPTP